MALDARGYWSARQGRYLPLPVIAGGAGDTVTTFTNVLKEFYPAGGVVNQLNVDTFLLDKLDKAKKSTGSVYG